MEANSQAQKMSQRLFQKWQKDALAHFYLLSGPRAEQRLENNQKFLIQWIEEFLAQVLQKEHNCGPERAHEKMQMGHPDILWIKPREKSSYTLQTGELDELFRSQNFRPTEMRHRFIIVEDAQLINRYLANKLLKTLEEPQPATSLIFLNPGQTELLPTLESRAVKIGLNPETSNDKPGWAADGRFHNPRELLQGLKNYATQHENSPNETSSWPSYAQVLSQFMSSHIKPHHTHWESDRLPLGQLLDELNISDQAQEQSLVSFLMEIESRKVTPFQQKQELLHLLKWSEESRLYHNSRRVRLWQQLEEVFRFS